MATHCQAMVGFLDLGAEVFDYGNSLRIEAQLGGFGRAFEYPGFLPAYIRPLFCEGKGAARRWPCPATPSTSPPPTEPCSRSSPTTRASTAGSPWRASGWRSRACPPASAGWATASATASACASTRWCAPARCRRPIVIGRDHLDSGSVASPYRETEAMADGSDAIADWPLLNALVNTASGATWVSIHHGGGVGIGRSIHAGQVSVADGTDLAAEKLERVLTSDPGMGVIRHVDAGYDRAGRSPTSGACASPWTRREDRGRLLARRCRLRAGGLLRRRHRAGPGRDRGQPGRPLATGQAGQQRGRRGLRRGLPLVGPRSRPWSASSGTPPPPPSPAS